MRDSDEVRMDREQAAKRAADPTFLDMLVENILLSGTHEVEWRGSRPFARFGEHVGEVTSARVAKGVIALADASGRRVRHAREEVLWGEADRIPSECATVAWLLAFPRTPAAKSALV